MRDITQPWYISANYYWVKQESSIKDFPSEIMKHLLTTLILLGKHP